MSKDIAAAAWAAFKLLNPTATNVSEAKFKGLVHAAIIESQELLATPDEEMIQAGCSAYGAAFLHSQSGDLGKGIEAAYKAILAKARGDHE
jgi:hypothetical protein